MATMMLLRTAGEVATSNSCTNKRGRGGSVKVYRPALAHRAGFSGSSIFDKQKH
jgi:hypothetical protein